MRLKVVSVSFFFRLFENCPIEKDSLVGLFSSADPSPLL